MKDYYPLGQIPSSKEIPQRMWAQVIRKDRYGDPAKAFQPELVSVPEIGPRQVLVYVMAAGLNFNNVWAARGYPVDVIGFRNDRDSQSEDFHIGGSDASGIVWKIGSDVRNVRPGDEIIVEPGYWNHDDPFILSGGDVMMAPSTRAWGYETNFGSFAQFCRVQDFQCIPKPQKLNWEQAACFMLTGATIYRMIHHWAPHTLKPGDFVLVWGGAGGLGSVAVPILRHFDAKPICVVASEEKKDYCISLGAHAVINRSLSRFNQESSSENRSLSLPTHSHEFVAEVERITQGEMPRIVIEHPGESTLTLSIGVVKHGGLVVTCGATTGYKGSFDLSMLLKKQVRLQGSHFADLTECTKVAELFAAGRVKPPLSTTYMFSEIPTIHQLMYENRHPPGNLVVRIGF